MPELKSMKLTPAEKQEDTLLTKRSDVPEYPYGLTLSLDDDALEKLDAPDLKVGDYVLVAAKAKVTRSSVHEERTEGEDGGPKKDVSLQIEELGIESASGNDAKRLYPTMED